MDFYHFSKIRNFEIFICGIYSLVGLYSYGKQTIWSINDILEQMARAYMFLRALKKLLTSVHVFQVFFHGEAILANCSLSVSQKIVLAYEIGRIDLYLLPVFVVCNFIQ